MHSSVVLEGNIVNLGTWAMCLVCIHICLSTMGRASRTVSAWGKWRAPQMWDLRREKRDSRKCGPWAMTWAQLRCVLTSCSFLLLWFAWVPQDEASERQRTPAGRNTQSHYTILTAWGSPTLWPWPVCQESGNRVVLHSSRLWDQHLGNPAKLQSRRAHSSGTSLVYVWSQLGFHGTSCIMDDQMEFRELNITIPDRQEKTKGEKARVPWGMRTESPSVYQRTWKTPPTGQEYSLHDHIWK